MASRGAKETDKLRQNVENQLDRLMAQLADLEVPPIAQLKKNKTQTNKKGTAR